MTRTQARVWNLGTCRFDAKGGIQPQTRENQSTDAKHRGGVMRSSEEGTVMVLERRHGLARFEREKQL